LFAANIFAQRRLEKPHGKAVTAPPIKGRGKGEELGNSLTGGAKYTDQ